MFLTLFLVFEDLGQVILVCPITVSWKLFCFKFSYFTPYILWIPLAWRQIHWNQVPTYCVSNCYKQARRENIPDDKRPLRPDATALSFPRACEHFLCLSGMLAFLRSLPLPHFPVICCRRTWQVRGAFEFYLRCTSKMTLSTWSLHLKEIC